MRTRAICLSLLGALPGAPSIASSAGNSHDAGHGSRFSRHERFLYVATIAQSAADPDFIAVVGADPRRRDFGRIVNRVDMPKAASARRVRPSVGIPSKAAPTPGAVRIFRAR